MEEETETPLALLATSSNTPLEESLVTNEAFANATLYYIFKYLDYKDLLNCSKVCPLWKQIAFQQSLWNRFTFYSCHRHIPKLFKTEYGPNIRNLNLSHRRSTDEDVARSLALIKVQNVKRLIISNSFYDELGRIISETNENIEEFQICNLALEHREFGLFLSKFDNLTTKLTHLHLVKLDYSCRHNMVANFGPTLGINKFTSLQHLGLDGPFDNSVWENIVMMRGLKSLQLNGCYVETEPDGLWPPDRPDPVKRTPKWMASLFGPKFTINSMQSLKKLTLHSIFFFPNYEVFQKIKLMTNLKELVLSEVLLSEHYSEAHFGIFLSQCQNLESLKIHHIQNVSRNHSKAWGNSEIFKGVLALYKTVKHFQWFLPTTSTVSQIPFRRFEIITTNQVRTYSSYVNSDCLDIISITELSEIAKNMLPDTKVGIYLVDEFLGRYQPCNECHPEWNGMPPL